MISVNEESTYTHIIEITAEGSNLASFLFGLSGMPDNGILGVVDVLGYLRQGFKDAHKIIQNAGESRHVQLQQATGLEGDVRRFHIGVLVSAKIFIEIFTEKPSNRNLPSLYKDRKLKFRLHKNEITQRSHESGSANRSLARNAIIPHACYFRGEEESDDVTSFTSNDPLCETTEWSEWSECSNTCGVGLKMRTRRFRDRRGRKRCPLVPLVEKDKCMEPPCPAGTEEQIDPTCKVSAIWTARE